MRINILRLTFEFRFPTIFDYKNIKNFINVVSSPSVRINMEDITYYKTNNELENSHSHIIIYNDSENILKQIDKNIKDNKIITN